MSTSGIFHRGLSDSVRYGSALCGTVLEFFHLVATSGHRHVPRAPLPAASRSACAEDRASKIFVILQNFQDYNIDIMVVRRVSRTEKPCTTRNSTKNDPRNGSARQNLRKGKSLLTLREVAPSDETLSTWAPDDGLHPAESRWGGISLCDRFRWGDSWVWPTVARCLAASVESLRFAFTVFSDSDPWSPHLRPGLE